MCYHGLVKRNSKQLMIRMVATERAIIRAACDALSTDTHEVSEGQLIYTAGLDEAGLMGFTMTPVPSGLARSRGARGQWKNKPDRSGSTGDPEPITITIHPLHYAPIEAAAEWAEVSLPTFLLGSTFAYIARWKAGAPENKRLQKIRLPAQYELRRSP